MTAPLISTILICAACGYQWDDKVCGVLASLGPREAARWMPRTFELDCPACDANMVHVYSNRKDGELPWF